MKLYLPLITLFVGLDQLTKALAREALKADPFMIEVTSFLNFTPSWNHGISFGLFNQNQDYGPYVLIGLTLVLIGFLFFWLYTNKTTLLSLALSCIIGGALGNLIDRFTFGAVFDFIDAHAFGVHFWTFNVADMWISLGAMLVILDMILVEWKKKKGL